VAFVHQECKIFSCNISFCVENSCIIYKTTFSQIDPISFLKDGNPASDKILVENRDQLFTSDE